MRDEVHSDKFSGCRDGIGDADFSLVRRDSGDSEGRVDDGLGFGEGVVGTDAERRGPGLSGDRSSLGAFLSCTLLCRLWLLLAGGAVLHVGTSGYDPGS